MSALLSITGDSSNAFQSKFSSNGSSARLIEKWFVAEKLGHHFWKMPSEEYYKNNQARYYETINLGLNYYELDYNKCIGFLEMLPNCLK